MGCLSGICSRKGLSKQRGFPEGGIQEEGNKKTISLTCSINYENSNSRNCNGLSSSIGDRSTKEVAKGVL